MPNYNLTFDIGPRQNGKTTRLIQSVIRYICAPSAYMGSSIGSSSSYDNKAVVIVPNTRIKRYIEEKLKPFMDMFPDQISVLSRPSKNVLRKTYGKRFYDEYKFCRYIEWRDGDYYNGEA